MPQQQGEEEDPLAGFGSSLFDTFNEADVNREEDGEFAPKDGGSSGSSDYDDNEPSKPKEKPKEPEEPKETEAAKSGGESASSENEGSAEYGPQPVPKTDGINTVVKNNGQITLDAETRKRYSESLLGITTAKGEVRVIADHVFDRFAEREISLEDVKKALETDTNPVWNDFHKTWNFKNGKVIAPFNPVNGKITTVMIDYRFI